MTKDEAVQLCRAHGIPTGDYARTPKGEYIRRLRAHGVPVPIDEPGPDEPGTDAAAAPDAAAAAAQFAAAVAALAARNAQPALDEARVRALIDEALASRPAQVQTVILPAPSAEPMATIDGPQHECLPAVVQAAAIGLNILLVGPAGCGKTELAGAVARALNRPLTAVSLSGGQGESALTGWLLPVAEGGRFEYVPSPFVTAYENGHVILLDELDAADANVIMVLNAALANGHFTVPHAVGRGAFQRHPATVIIAAANTFGTGADRLYVGRNQLDAATLDRFAAATFELDYSDAIERAVVDAELLDWAKRVREIVRARKIRRVVSTRTLAALTRAMRAGLPLEHAKARLLTGWTADERKAVEG